jgi:RNA polymerase sigma-70 factor (ECF subfamily)
MREIRDRFAERSHARFAAQTTFDDDERPGELSHALARAKAGDAGAIRYLYLRFSGNVYGYTRSIVGDAHEAEDITQQVFARLVTAIGSYEPRGVPFSAWLLRIAHNMAIDHIRRNRATPSELEWLSAAGSDSVAGELSMDVRSAIAELPEGQREVVVMRHIAGWSPPEIADHLGKSEEAVHGLHHRGRRALREGLTRREAVPMAMSA